MSYRSIFSGPEIDLILASIKNKLDKSGSYTVANLPTDASEGTIAFATNGRKVGQGAGAGTGVPVYFSAGAWRVFSTDSPVAV
jgi:hypothetical protein